MNMNGSGRSVSVALPVTIKIGPPDLELFKLGGTVDRVALQKGSHWLVIGRVKGGCCSKLLRARIVNGDVIGFRTERCKETMRADPRFIRLVQQVKRKLGSPKRRALHPIPIAQFLKPGVMQRTVAGIWTSNCYFIYVSPLPPLPPVCLFCCDEEQYFTEPGPQPKATRSWCLRC
jgi:hypothetical protein